MYFYEVPGDGVYDNSFVRCLVAVVFTTRISGVGNWVFCRHICTFGPVGFKTGFVNACRSL
jgi:hypothetical protein